MELDELRKTWTALDNRLKENNSLNERVILEMVEKKANKSISKLIFWDGFSIVAFLILIPVIAYFLNLHHGKLLFWDIAMTYLLVNLVIGAIWYYIKVQGLMKLDVNKNISSNVFYVNKYNIQIKREKFIMNYIIGPPIAILFVLTYLEAKASLALWVFLVCALVLASLSTYWGYKRFYQKNIESIRKSLDEIKNLKEE
ncbi:MAG: hypothetical protein PHO94_03535 [Petrimonas sp.]|nr:hypothetical protein [Petrimonas sp.]